MKQRIEFIDGIKGFAILLVVMGHVIANWFADFYATYEDDLYNQLIVWRLIYAFHMPLFMFSSGLFQPVLEKDTPVKVLSDVIIRRFKVLMIPYFVSGLLLWGVTGKLQLYWFLLILFEFVVITLLASIVVARLFNNSKKAEIIALLALCLALKFVTKFCSEYELLPLLDIGHLILYPYFVVGYIVAKYKLLERAYPNWIYTLAVLIFSVLFVLKTIADVKVPLRDFLIAFSAIFAVFYFFKEEMNKENRVFKSLCFMGRHSLEIYILHFFFLTKLPFVGDMIYNSSVVGEGRIVVVFGIILSLLQSIINLFLCYLLWRAIKPSKFLSRILLGRSYSV